MGRFVSPDDVGGHLEDPQPLNLYSYVANNSLSRTDPSGHDFWQSCQEESSECGHQVIGTGTDGKYIKQLVSGRTDSNGDFHATVVTSASLGQASSGNKAAVNGGGVMIYHRHRNIQSANGAGNIHSQHACRDIQGQGAGWNQFSFHIDSNDVAHGVLDSGNATYNGSGGHQGMLDTLNSMTAGGHGPWQYKFEDYYNIFHLGDHNIRFSTGADPLNVKLWTVSPFSGS
jgi:hypothetical protein